jgi:hypothetical protein
MAAGFLLIPKYDERAGRVANMRRRWIESSHELLLGALGAQNVLAVGDEALADEAALAHGADEAVVVPVPVLERDVPGPADAFTEKNKNTNF